MGPTVTLKTAFSRFFPPLTAIVLAAASVLIIIDGGLSELTQSVPFLVASALLVWALFWVPHVEVSDGGIRMVNVVHIVHIPWPCFISADPRWTLKVETTQGTYTSWALPAGSGTARRLTSRSRTSREATPHGGRQLRDGTAEGAALVIVERLDGLTDAGFLEHDTVQSVQVEKTVNSSSLWTFAAVATLVALGLLS